jgi:hypothetical protein
MSLTKWFLGYAYIEIQVDSNGKSRSIYVQVSFETKYIISRPSIQIDLFLSELLAIALTYIANFL